MTNLRSDHSNQRMRAVRLSITVGLAMLFLVVLLCGLRGVMPARADPDILYVDRARGQDTSTCGTTSTPCKTISYTLNSRASGGDTIRVAQGVYTENLTVDKQVTLEGGYESVGWTRNISQYETVIDGSNSRTVAGDWDGHHIGSPMVISTGVIFEMWYDGRDLTDTQIGRATSPDEINWTKDAENPLLGSGAPFAWDYGSVWEPFVLLDGGTYEMWYTADDNAIGYVTSTNGITWTRCPDPVLEGGPSGAWDEGGVSDPYVIKASGTYTMWYESWTDTGRIGCATSTDGINWTKCAANPVLRPGNPGDWDETAVHDPVVVLHNGIYHMWYRGTDPDWTWHIGYVTSTNGTTWNRFLTNPVLSGTAGQWDEGTLSLGDVFFDGATYHMWYGANGQVGYATSTNGITWTKSPSNPVLSPGTPGQWGQSIVKFVSGINGAVLDGFTVRNGEAWRGGGIFISNAEVTVQNCTVTNNQAAFGGGGIYVENGANATIRNTRVLSNSTEQRFGGGIYVIHPHTQADIRASVVANNRGGEWGGGGIVVDYHASATLVGNEIVSNTCSADGGGGIRVNNHAFAEIQDNFVAYNQAEYGGGIAVTYYSTATVTHNRVFSNAIRGWGGGGVVVTDYATATILSNQVVSNTAISGAGGGIRLSRAQATIAGNFIQSNLALGGGGIEASWQSCADVYSNTITGNRATAWGGGGVRLTDYAIANVDRNRIMNNAIGGSGGGVAVGNGSIVTVTNSVIALNAGSDSDGIVVWAGGDDSNVWIINNTIVSNSAEGIQADKGTVLARNNIIYGNNGGIHNYQSGATVASDHNAFWNNGWDYANVTPGAGDISTDPLFVDAANGDYHLQGGSPCIDAGTGTGAPLVDFEGDPRPLDGDLDGTAVVDIGADEFKPYQIYLPLTLRNVGA